MAGASDRPQEAVCAGAAGGVCGVAYTTVGKKPGKARLVADSC